MTDIYPSRGGRKAEFLERQDPVNYAQETERSPLGRDVLQAYQENGFVILPNLFTADEIHRFQAELERLRSDRTIQSSDQAITEPGGGEVRSIFAVHSISSVFRELIADPRLAGLASYLLDDDVYIHQSRVNYKPGFRGKEFYWHSDFETWHVEDGMPRMRALSMSIALTKNFTYNGSLMLIPGSHQMYAVCEGETPADHFKSSLKKQEYGIPSDNSLRRMADRGGIETATGEPGSVILFDCNTMHGSNGNISPYPRSNIFFVYNAISNRVLAPFGKQPPRPEYICSRETIEPLDVHASSSPVSS